MHIEKKILNIKLFVIKRDGLKMTLGNCLSRLSTSLKFSIEIEF